MAVQIVINLKNTKAAILGIIALQNSMGLVGQQVKALNEEQIKKFITAKGHRVKAYSDKKDRFGKTYYEKKGVARGAVDFLGKKAIQSKKQRATGHMMNDFDITDTGKGFVEVGFNSQDSKEKAAGNYNKRKFIGLTKKNRSRLIAWIRTKFNI